MKRRMFLMVSAIVLGSGLLSWTIQRRGAVALREATATLEERDRLLASLKDDCARLSSEAARAASLRPFSHEQLRELLRLRGETGMLLAVKSEMARLPATKPIARGTSSITLGLATRNQPWSPRFGP